ncbi:MAG: DUF434 domain-containing protein [Planctomycetes bacterium]|nr:DUF434 domain-containing protein [Planctomycetota bacterium]
MPDRRRHRGPHPGDLERFAAAQLPALRLACADLGWLAARGYPPKAALQLVGDRFALDLRQRQAVARASAAPEVAAARKHRELPLGPLPELWIDGFNVLTTVEAALAGGVVLGCADGCRRDLASLHGTWREVLETCPAAALVGERLAAAGVAQVVFWLDAPVGNSGRLAKALRELAGARGLPWRVETVPSPDRVLVDAPVPVATADSAVLDRSARWVNLARAVVVAVPGAWLVDLAGA